MGSINEDLRNWFSKSHPEGGWKRINSKGEAIGPCAREPGEPKPKCMSNEKRAMLSKGERASAVRAKRRHDPNPEREGKPIMVSNFGKGKITEEKKNEPTNKGLWSKIQSLVSGKVSSIEHNGKTIDGPNNGKGFRVHPSAFSNGWASAKYKELGGDWKSVNEGLKNFNCFVDRDSILSDMSTTNRQLIDGVLSENECEGRQSGKPWRTPGERKKFAVCADGKLVRFGDPGLSIKRDQPGRLRNFRARHGCDKGGIARDTPKYWSCQMWRKDKSVTDLTGGQ
jgi:hypothetical protein